MTTTLNSRIGRTLGLVVAVTAIALAGAASVRAGDRPAASFYTPKQLQAMSRRWAAKGALSSPASAESKALLESIVLANGGSVDSGRPSASYYTKQQLEAMSQRWALRGALSSMTPEQRGILLQGNIGQAEPAVRPSGFDWGDFGIGAAGMLGLVLLVGGSVVAVRFGRRDSGLSARQAT